MSCGRLKKTGRGQFDELQTRAAVERMVASNAGLGSEQLSVERIVRPKTSPVSGVALPRG